jgi:hypothetical protein
VPNCAAASSSTFIDIERRRVRRRVAIYNAARFIRLSTSKGGHDAYRAAIGGTVLHRYRVFRELSVLGKQGRGRPLRRRTIPVPRRVDQRVEACLFRSRRRCITVYAEICRAWFERRVQLPFGSILHRPARRYFLLFRQRKEVLSQEVNGTCRLCHGPRLDCWASIQHWDFRRRPFAGPRLMNGWIDRIQMPMLISHRPCRGDSAAVLCR